MNVCHIKKIKKIWKIFLSLLFLWLQFPLFVIIIMNHYYYDYFFLTICPVYMIVSLLVFFSMNIGLIMWLHMTLICGIFPVLMSRLNIALDSFFASTNIKNFFRIAFLVFIHWYEMSVIRNSKSSQTYRKTELELN